MRTAGKRGWLAAVFVVCVAVAGLAFGGEIAGGGNYIGEAEAKAIAYRHAGVAEENVQFVRTSMDMERRRVVYEVEFYSGSVEYDYEIDAVSGRILEMDMDRD